jgi:ABC-type thiamine transport system substrate-binding protein
LSYHWLALRFNHYPNLFITMSIRHIAITSSLLVAASVCQAQGSELNIYSARHYPTDEALYADFTKASGIKINRVDSDDAGILARLKAEGTASAADVILLVDASRLWRGESDGLFQVSAPGAGEGDSGPAAQQTRCRGQYGLVRILDPRPRHRV